MILSAGLTHTHIHLPHSTRYLLSSYSPFQLSKHNNAVTTADVILAEPPQELPILTVDSKVQGVIN